MKNRSKKGAVLGALVSVLVVCVVVLLLVPRSGTVRYAPQPGAGVPPRAAPHPAHVTTAVQQIMIGSLCKNETSARAALQAIKDAGYEAIELNDFMIHKTGLTVKLLTKVAGMPVGNGGGLDWPRLIRESGLGVVSLHCTLAAIEEDPQTVALEAQCFGTDTVVITAMYRFDYARLDEVQTLARRLNEAGAALSQYGIRLLYHNHNVELQKVAPGKTPYDVLIEETDARFVNFEFDSYWAADSGADVAALMEKLGGRLKLWHINDRGCKDAGPYTTPILKMKATELGYGNMNLPALARIARANGVEGVILETHNNWAQKSPVKSLQLSAAFMQQYFSDADPQ